MTLALYGIPNCDSVRRARAWLDARGADYAFHDYKKGGIDPARLARWADAVGWEVLLNRRGTTWRTLPEADRADMDRDRACALMVARPSLIKRPVAQTGDAVLVGFDAGAWATALG